MKVNELIEKLRVYGEYEVYSHDTQFGAEPVETIDFEKPRGRVVIY